MNDDLADPAYPARVMRLGGRAARTAPSPIVAIPARDEEALLPRLVASLSRQTVVSRTRPLEVVIVLNNTTDRSREVVAAAARKAPGLRVTVEEITYPERRAHVGSARRRAMEIAAGWRPDGVILTTDADAVPAEDWIEANMRAIAAGADLVGGRIFGDPGEEARLGPGFQRRARLHARYGALRDELAALIDPVEHDPWPRHQDHTGASLAVRAEVYAAVGGLDPLPFREDLAFVSKVRAAGFRLSHPLDVRVTVSARTSGRAPGGMADCLRSWIREEERGDPVLVECPGAVMARLRRRRAIRDRAWPDIPFPEPPLVELIERFAADDPDAPATVPAELAIADLEDRITELRGRCDAA